MLIGGFLILKNSSSNPIFLGTLGLKNPLLIQGRCITMKGTVKKCYFFIFSAKRNQGQEIMNKENYLQMDSERLYKYLISDILANPSDARILVEELEKTHRYREDYEFRTFVETGRGLVHVLDGEPEQVISVCARVIERAIALKMWQLVSTNLNFLGNAYFFVGFFERALDYYHKVIKIEEAHKLHAMTSIAYYNIALIYNALDAHKEACENLQLALDVLEQGGPEQARYMSKQLSYLGGMIISLCHLGRSDEIPPLLERAENIPLNKVNQDSVYIYQMGKMYYAFYTGDYQNGKEFYYSALSCISEGNAGEKMSLLRKYLELCASFGLGCSFYEKELRSAQFLEKSERIAENVRVYPRLLNYYKESGDRENYDRTAKKYMEIIKSSTESARNRQLHFIQTYDVFVRNRESEEEIRSRKTELQLIADEAVRHKNALQRAYDRIEMINELGRNMTSSLNLDEVIDSIYQNLQRNIPLSNFILMIADLEKTELCSVAFYEDGVKQPPFCVDLDNPDSIFAECYRTGEMIISKEIYSDPRFAKRNLVSIGSDKVKSVVFLPLRVGEQLVGICSLQDETKDVYKEASLDFLEQILPYLSIALNNAIRSSKLEQEIKHRFEVQTELEHLNNKLERLSSLDILTQIGNRRDFEFKFLQLLRQAQEHKTEISVLMFDIDNFKLYNDTYGHLEGDEGLKKVAKVIRFHMDKVNGICARFGGEEFIGACSALGVEQSKNLANRIRKDIYELGIENKKAPSRKLSVSIGVVVGKIVDPSRKSAVMRWADTALYHAKNTGKNKVVIKEISFEEKIDDGVLNI